MNNSKTKTAVDSAGAVPPQIREVLLRVLLEVLSKYEHGAGELSAEFEMPEITPELLMHVCLAAPEVDDLIVGFIRDDLNVVSLADQTRQIADRDIGFLARDPTRWMGLSGGSLGRQLTVRHQAEAEARMAQGCSSELEEFIRANPDVHEKVRALKHSDLVRWVLLSLMRETNGRKRGSAVIAGWREQLAPELRKQVEAIRTQFGAGQTASARLSPPPKPAMATAKLILKF